MNATPATEVTQRQNAVLVCHRLADLGLIGAGEGNVSILLGPGRILTTPSGVNKAFLQPEQLVVADGDGKKLEGERPPSSELQLHLAVYRARPDVGAVVHAHPLTAVALTLAGLDLSKPVMPEAVTVLGETIPTAPYATPSTRELADGVAKALGRHEACLMERHGALAVGRDILEACDRMETVERLAQVLLRTRLLGATAAPLPADEVDRLLRLSGRR